MTKQTREGLAALCGAFALLLIGAVWNAQWALGFGVVIAVLALGALAVDLVRR